MSTINHEIVTIVALRRCSILDVMAAQLVRYRDAHGGDPPLALINRSLQAPLAIECYKRALIRSPEITDPFEFWGVQFFFSISRNSPVWIRLIDKEKDIEMSL